MAIYNIHIIIITIAVLVILYKYYIRLNGKISFFTITSFFCLWYIVYALIGSAALNCYKFDSEDWDGIYSYGDKIFKVWMLTIIGFIGLFVGFTLSHCVHKKRSLKKYTRIVLSKEIEALPYEVSTHNFKYTFSLFIFSVIVLILYRFAIGAFPLESIFSGLSRSELNLLRSDATNTFTGRLYLFDMFMKTMPLFLFIVVSFISSKSNDKKWKIFFYLLLIYNIFFCLITLQKNPIIRFLLVCWIISIFKKRKINKTQLVGLVIFSVGLIILMYTFFMGMATDSYPISEILEGAVHRIFISSITPLFWYIKYTDEFGLLYGTTFPNPAGIFPFDHFKLTFIIMEYAHGIQASGGSMPTAFIGEMYANFGYIGVIISSVFWGYVLQSLDFFFLKRLSVSKFCIYSGMYIFMIDYLSGFTISGISSIITDTRIYLVVILYLIYKKRMTIYKKHCYELQKN